MPLASLDPAVRDRFFGGPLLVVSKTNAETAIHRRARMDYIAVKRIDDAGKVVGELRMIGLFTSKAYAESAHHIPLVRRKLEAIMRWEDLISGSHDYKAVVELFDSFPKDELFAAPPQELRATIMALAAMQEERNVRLFLRSDPGRKTVWAIVALPRDRVTTELRLRLEHLFEYRFHGTVADYALSFSTDPARFHFTIHVGDDEMPDVSLADLQREVADAGPLVGRRPLGRARRDARRRCAGTSSPAATPPSSPSTTRAPPTPIRPASTSSSSSGSAPTGRTWSRSRTSAGRPSR